MKIDIIGRGNVATHLHKAWHSSADVTMINPHTLSGLRSDSDIAVIAVSDNAIPEVASRLSDFEGIVAHTSGTTPIDTFGQYRVGKYGVLYPLQTFSKDKSLNYDTIPVFIEGNDAETATLLSVAASLISNRVKIISSDQRAALHVAAVLCCNFTNHLWALGDSYLRAKGLDFDDIRPLIAETARKIVDSDPADVQTGPAVRRDTVTLDRHLDILGDDARLTQIYRILTDSIMSLNDEVV